jgi:uncharacterized membrane protein
MAESTRVLNISPEEIEAGKTMAFVSYLIFWLPLVLEDSKKNKFIMFHTEQSIVLVILWVISFIVSFIIGMFTCGIGFILLLFPFILEIIGIINAFSGKVAILPLVGQFGEKINLIK